MPWYGWVILVVAGVVVLAAVALRAFRASRRGRRFLALSTRAKLDFGRELLRDPQVPLTAKVALIVLVGYLALPFDLIPDFIPVLGQADDVLVVVAAVGLLIMSVPRERFEAALEGAETAEERRRVGRAATV